MIGYNPLERPVVNESAPLLLTFGITLQQIIDVVRIFTNYNLVWHLTKERGKVSKRDIEMINVRK